MEAIASAETVAQINPVEQLDPMEFTDEDGARREVFEFKTVKGNRVGVVFYTREELPFSSEILKGREGFILGEVPKHRDAVEWQGFVDDVRSASNPSRNPCDLNSFQIKQAFEQDRALLFVENTPVHILDAAFLLGLEGGIWRNARQKAALDRIYTPEVIGIIDDMIAATVVDDKGHFVHRENQRGEALTLMALLGNGHAREILDEKKKIIEREDERRSREKEDSAKRKEADLMIEGVKMPGKVWAFHTTNYRPKITPQGIELTSSFDATGGVMTRNTIHFSLNEPITGHYGISGIENLPYVVIGDLAAMRQVNGNPLMINRVDTYFVLNPGQRLIIPNGELKMPGHLPYGVISEKQGQITIYKNEGLSTEDINTIFLKYYDEISPRGKEEIHRLFRDKLSGWLRQSKDLPKEEAIRRHNFTLNADCEAIFSNLRTKGIEQAITTIFFDGNIQANGKEEETIKKNVENWLVSKIRNETFREIVSTDDSDLREAENFKLLAASWGTNASNRSQAHSEDPDGGFGLQNWAGRIFDAVREDMTSWVRERKTDPLALKPITRLNWNRLNEEGIDIEDRKSIMDAFRHSRLSILAGDRMMRPENRRMYFLAGLI